MEWIIIPIMALSIPIVAIISDHFQKKAKLKGDLLKEQLELEKLKHQNYLIETEKLRLELEKMQIETNEKTKFL